MLITTNSGLWRYKIGDTVKFTSVDPFRIIISGRTKHFINAFGEEVIIDNVEKALEKVIKKHKCKIVDYTVAPRFMQSGKKGNHDWIIEFSKEPKNIKDFMFDLDLITHRRIFYHLITLEFYFDHLLCSYFLANHKINFFLHSVKLVYLMLYF